MALKLGNVQRNLRIHPIRRDLDLRNADRPAGLGIKIDPSRVRQRNHLTVLIEHGNVSIRLKSAESIGLGPDPHDLTELRVAFYADLPDCDHPSVMLIPPGVGSPIHRACMPYSTVLKIIHQSVQREV